MSVIEEVAGYSPEYDDGECGPCGCPGVEGGMDLRPFGGPQVADKQQDKDGDRYDQHCIM